MIVRLINALVSAFVLSIFVTASVLAHAHLEESDPDDGSTITTPYTLTARFSGEFDADRSFIRVVDAAGTRVADGAVNQDNPTVMVVELPELEIGEYEVRWQTVTPEDNGVERGTFTFTVAEAATPSPSPRPSPSTTAAPTGTAPSTSVAPAASPTVAPFPTASPQAIDGSPAGSGNDLMLALVLAAGVIGAVLLFVFARNRR